VREVTQPARLPPGTDDGMAARVRAHDWSSTPVGPAHGWPQSLQTALSICLSSRFPMHVWWGPELTVFYNDAYVPAMGDKHPDALGRRASRVWAEAWSELGPLAESVLAGEGATFSEDQLLFLRRHGYLEETYWTFSYSPIQDESGGIGGIFVAVSDTTTRVVGERRLRVLGDLGELSTVSVGTAEEASRAVVGVLARHRAEVPFVAAYLRSPEGNLRLVAAHGVTVGSAVAPPTLHGPADGGPVWRVAETGTAQVVRGFVDGAADAVAPCLAGPAAPTDAVVLPVCVAGRIEPAGVLVAGVNPYRELDADHRSFFDLVADQLATAVTDALAYEAERQRAEALAELDRAKTDFFSNVSHEFRTPLTLIMGPVTELRAAPAIAADARLREELDVIHRNALRLGKLVNSLLDFSRLQAGRVEAHFEPVDLAAYTAELASVFRSAVDRAGIDYVVEVGPLPEAVYVDRDMWEKIVLNLLSNALKFTFEGRITVALRAQERAAELIVADTGTGVPADEVPRLFERFHRVERARARSGEGSGIGLAVVRELIGLHGGTITVDSAPQRGTTFRVLLPWGYDHLPSDRVAPTSTERGPAAAESFVAEALRWLPDDEPEQPAAPVGAGRGRVLVADDNADMREYLTRLLRPRYAVRVVSDGAAALAAIREEPPDLVVSDVMMPGLDGMELVAAVRADPRTARIPVLLLSARAGQESAVEGLAAGADDYLVKPFSAAELLARVAAHLQLGRARREAEARFTAIADLAPALIWVAGPDGARGFVNAGWRQFTGRAADEPGADWQEGLHPEDRARYRQTVTTAMAAHRGWEVEFRLRRADGVYRWLLERAVPIGPTEGWVGSCTDINVRYRESERQGLLARFGAGLESEPGPAAQAVRLARLVIDARLADLCCVLRIDDDGRLRPDGIAGVDADTEAAVAAVAGIHPESPTVREVVTTGRSRLIADVPEVGSPEWSAADVAPDQLALYRRIVVRSALLLPLSARGRVLGVLALLRRGDSPRYDDDDRALMEEVAGRAAAALDNALLLAEERATAARLAVLQRATAELSAAVTPAEVGAAAVAHLARLVGDFSTVGVYEIDGPGAALVPLALEKIDDTARPRLTSVPLQSPLVVAEAVREQRPLWVDDVEAPEWAATHPGWADVLGGLGIRGVIAIPLIAGGRAVGVMGVGFRVPLRECAIERSTLTALAEQCAQAMDRARLYRAEHRVAETLQRSLLPQRLPQLPRLALDARYLPGAEGVQAGGDWYDVIELDEHRVAIAVGDVVGQGAAAAAVMGQLRSALAAALLQGHGPAAALELLDRFAARVPGARASTAACLTLDWAAGLVCWARAGHPPALLADSAGVRLLDGDGHGPVLGLTGRAPYSEGVTGLEAGATLVLYTDGLVERRGEVIDEGLDRLAEAVRRHAGGLPVALVPAVLDDLTEHGHAADDIAVIAARLMPAPLHQRLPADPAQLAVVRRTVRQWAASAGLGDDLSEDLLLAMGEAAANAVEHAYRDGASGDWYYEVARRGDGSLDVLVQDWGSWRPPPADPGFRGRGVEFVRHLADEVSFERGVTGTTVRFRLGVPADGPERDRAPAAASEPPPDGPVVVAPRELDLATVEAVRADLLGQVAVLPDGGRLTLDLRPTTYLPSAGIGLLLEVLEHARARGVDLRILAEPTGLPARAFALAGLDMRNTGAAKA
jgi:PAS domain S-box-containing protein